jgi:unsaturated chondroitin disaccharide hydrolase
MTETPNHTRLRKPAVRRSCNSRFSWPPVPSLARSLALLPLLAALESAAVDLSSTLSNAWVVAEQRSVATVNWMSNFYGGTVMYWRFPTVGDLANNRWSVTSSTGDWHAGFWPGTLWLLSQRTGSSVWLERATNWSYLLAYSSNTDHDIGFITMGSLGKAWYCNDDLTDPAGTYRAFASNAIVTAAGKLNSRFNKPNGSSVPVPANFTRSWDSIEGQYPVCIDNMMNLEVLLLGYEITGRPTTNRVWFDHALAHARSSIAKHLRPDGSTYHVVRHFETGSSIGQVQRKNTRQGFGDETTWSRGQSWAIYGFTMVYRYARADPATDASDILAAAQATADYFLTYLPNNRTNDSYNLRHGDFVPPSDFDAALGESGGPWCDANNNGVPNETNSGTLGDGRTYVADRIQGVPVFTLRDSSAAAVAAAGLIELSGYVSASADRERYLAAAENILNSLITYDGDDADSAPDYWCDVSEGNHPGILKAGSRWYADSYRSLIYGDYYFLEALTRYEALQARERILATQRVTRSGVNCEFEFERQEPAPALMFRVQKSSTLEPVNWTTIAAKTGSASWSGLAAVVEEPLPGGRIRVRVADPAPGAKGFFRVVTRSAGGY